ncbi:MULTISPECIES: glutaminase A [Elizabethkingia]|uniref:Glutaminase n=1 Tax=Elizabethkingia anophelis NUHP1 TaxID=1338011 RepID=A0A077EF98_9FLAO|nr:MULTISPECIES: glutaminase A [Elizabethkingia]AIL44854.1 Glutaminase [Elizabethkingia anophelis NUHP1]AVF49911.1 glutaminase A [Elizabethkingia anophelis]AVF50532.1 glutaminase A [Elizabethkingia anophelis]MBE9393312.1 glutaminase A [Elizabethkingia anophelis]MBE9406088.1 glutaminase A [Elizabethkingia anophelis]
MKKNISTFVFGILLTTTTLSFSTAIKAQAIASQKTNGSAITEQVLKDILEKNRSYYQQGKVADYIPELGKADSKSIALSVIDENGKVINIGDTDKKFTIQSISKIISLMIAVREKGEQNIFDKMGYFGTDKPFNHFSNLETTGKPLNPMMNAGAILTTSLIDGEGEEPFKKILEMVRYITKNSNINYSKEVYNSERETGHRNRGMFYIMKNNGLITGNEEKLNNYFKQCSIEVTAEDLAKIGYFFAHQCTRYDGDTTYKNADIAQLVESQMLIAGMYEFSGEYARTVGLPSKSGVGGGITVSVPGKMGIGVYSPALDQHGNSLAGYHMILDLVKKYNLSLFR